MSNEYKYNDPNDIIFLTFKEDFNATNGTQPSLVGTACNIVLDEKPVGANASLFCPSGNTIKYSDLPIDFDIEDDFTIDFYMRYQTGYSGISSSFIGNIFGFAIQPDALWYGNNASPSYNGKRVLTNAQFEKNKWVHYALVRKDGITYWFVDGKYIKTNNPILKFTNREININARYTNGYNGGPAHYSHVRISNIARWTEDFTPPLIEKIDKPNPEPTPEMCCIPAGMVMYFAANAVPKGWLMCDGSDVAKDTYANLYATIGDTFGVVSEESESKTFKLPDLRGEFIRCFDAEKGVDAGRVFGSTQLDVMQNHCNCNNTVVATKTASATEIRFADETRPRNVALVACIKY